MKIMILLVISLLLFGCNNPKSVRVEKVTKRKCTSEKDRDKLANFIVKCAEAANPKSDEEGEDLVAQCEQTGINVVCPEQVLCIDGNAEVYRAPEPCDTFNKRG